MSKKKKSDKRSNRWLPILLVISFVVVIIVVVLALLGPATGDIFSNTVLALDPGEGVVNNQPQSKVADNSDALLYAQSTATSLSLIFSTPNSQTSQSTAAALELVESTPAPLPAAGGGVAEALIVPGRELVTEEEHDAEPELAEPPTDMFFDDYGVNPFLDTEDDNLSTFAMDVDTASYTLARGYILDNGQLPPPEAIRSEEFINFFDVNYPSPEDGDAFAIHLDAAPAPFGFDDHYLLRVGLQGQYIAPEDRDPALLIFVIDISGSMSGPERLGRVKESLALLVDQLRQDDRVGIVVYADNTRVVLEPTTASETGRILSAINSLNTEGSTYAEAGLRLGYDMAQNHMRDGETTRVILLSDGVANVGETGPDAILNTVREGVDAGVTLSTIGFGMSNFNDVLMEQLANDGNGNYYYVDTLREARRIFVHNLTGTLQVIAYDAKVQVDFNTDVTDRYRLIGYENRAIADEDFRNDTVDAGEVGAGHSITALYELALENADANGLIATVYIRYQDAETREIIEISREITTDDLLSSIDEAPADMRLLAGVAEFSELLRESFWAEDGTYGAVLALVEPLADEMANNTDIPEFIQMVRQAIRFGDT